MQLSVRDAARLFNVSDKTIYRWISQGRLPAYKINDQIRFNKAELLEWATSKKINMSAVAFEEENGDSSAQVSLESALRVGGIYYRVGGGSVHSVLKEVVEIVPTPDGVEREFLLQMLLARESLGSTGIGQGISIPHPRNPIITHSDRPMVSLCFLEKPVDFNALDGKPVHTLFTILSPTIKSHLNMLSRIAFALQNPSFMKLIEGQATRQVLLLATADIDSQLCSAHKVKEAAK